MCSLSSEKFDVDYESTNLAGDSQISYSQNFIGHQAKDGILILDPKGTILDVNTTACELMGFNRNDLLGVSITHFFIETIFFISSDWDKSKANSFSFEKALYNSNRQTIDTEINVYLLDNEKIFIIIKDNSELKKVNEQNQKIFEELKFNRDLLEEQSAELVKVSEQLSESEDQLKELIKEKDKFISIIAHDIKSPFTGLIGLSTILKEGFETFDKERLGKYLIQIDELIKNQYKLIENLLDWSRLQSGKLKCNITKVNLLHSVNYVCGLINQNAANKSISLNNNITNDLYVKADELMLNSILENVLVNAIKFTEPGGSVAINSFKENSMISIEVQDSGIGIDPFVLENILRIDISHSTPGTNMERGTGLGLIICKEMVDRQNGTIKIISEPGKGTKVIIKLNDADNLEEVTDKAEPITTE